VIVFGERGSPRTVYCGAAGSEAGAGTRSRSSAALLARATPASSSPDGENAVAPSRASRAGWVFEAEEVGEAGVRCAIAVIDLSKLENRALEKKLELKAS
jgi:hypothetical protein